MTFFLMHVKIEVGKFQSGFTGYVLLVITFPSVKILCKTMLESDFDLKRNCLPWVKGGDEIC